MKLGLISLSCVGNQSGDSCCFCILCNLSVERLLIPRRKQFLKKSPQVTKEVTGVVQASFKMKLLIRPVVLMTITRFYDGRNLFFYGETLVQIVVKTTNGCHTDDTIFDFDVCDWYIVWIGILCCTDWVSEDYMTSRDLHFTWSRPSNSIGALLSCTLGCHTKCLRLHETISQVVGW